MNDIVISSSAAPTPQSRPQSAPAAETTKVQAPPSFVQAPYFSPVVKLDPSTKVAVVMYRNSETGEVNRQVELGQATKKYETNATEGSKTTASTSTASAKSAEGAKRSSESTEKAEVEADTPEKPPTDTVV